MKSIKRLNILFFILILLFSLTSCSFIFNAVDTNPNNKTNGNITRTTIDMEDKTLKYHVVGVSEYDEANANLSFVAYENQNYDEILNQVFEIPGYIWLGLFYKDTTTYNYTQETYSNVLYSDYIRGRNGDIDIYLIFDVIFYSIYYSNDFTYEEYGSVSYNRKSINSESNLRSPKADWYDFDGTWTFSPMSNPDVSFSSFIELIHSEYGYENILATPNATLKNIQKKGTLNLGDNFDNIEFDFQTGNIEEVDVVTLLESQNIEIPEKIGYDSSLEITTFTPINYADQDLIINVSYIPTEYTINLSYNFTGTNGSHLEGETSTKYTIENDNIQLNELNILDENTRKVLKIEYWIDKNTNERIDQINTTSLKNYNLEASLSLIEYQITVVSFIRQYGEKYKGYSAHILDKTINFNDFGSTNTYNLSDFRYEVRDYVASKANISFTKSYLDDVIDFRSGENYVTFKRQNGFDLNYSLLDEESRIIKLSFDNLQFNFMYFNVNFYLDDEYWHNSYQLTMDDIKDLFNKYCKETVITYSDYWNNESMADYVSVNRVDGTELKNLDEVFNEYVLHNEIRIYYSTKKYEVEYFLPEGWTTTNATVINNKDAYYNLTAPTFDGVGGVFYGWALSPDSTEYVTRYRPSTYYVNGVATEQDGVAGNTVRKLYAITELPKAKLVFHYGNGLDDEEKYLYLSNETYTIEEYFYEDKIIRDWYFDQDLLLKANNTINISTAFGTIDLYPKWEDSKYIVGFSSKTSDLDYDFSDIIIDYYDYLGFETIKIDDVVYVLYTSDNIPEVFSLTYPGNNPNSVFAYFKGWNEEYKSGTIDESLQNKYMGEAPILTPDYIVYRLVEDGNYLRLTVYSTIIGDTTTNDISGARKICVDDGNNISESAQAAISYFGLTIYRSVIKALYYCTDKTIPELYVTRSNPDISNADNWVSANDSNAYGGNYKKFSGASYSSLGNANGEQTLTLTISMSSDPLFVILSQHNSKNAGGGSDVYNPLTRVAVTYEIVVSKQK